MSPTEFYKHIRQGPHKVKDLAELYGVCSRTMRRYINKIEAKVGKPLGHYYMFPQVEIIVEHLGPP